MWHMEHHYGVVGVKWGLVAAPLCPAGGLAPVGCKASVEKVGKVSLLKNSGLKDTVLKILHASSKKPILSRAFV